MDKVTAIVLAAGQGKRMNSPVAKQFLSLQGRPVLYYSLMAFQESNASEIILVTGEGQVDYCRKEIVDLYRISKVKQVVEGGRERYDSVYRALQCASPTDYVLIHDGARPFITSALINQMIDQVKEYRACLLGMPVKETIKVVDENGMVQATPKRNTLWAAQTPQAFAFSPIKEAYDALYREEGREGLAITDDAMVYEAYEKRPVKMLPGDYNNIKLTTPEDFILAEQILEHR